MRRKKLTIEPRGGLCNRIRAVESALAMAEDHDMTVHMVWRMDQNFGCRFEELFQPIGQIERLVHWRRPRVHHKDGPWFQRRLGLWPTRPVLLQDDVARIIHGGGKIEDHIGSRGLYLRTWHRIHPRTDPGSLFKPIPPIQAKIDAYADRLGHAIGVHIRHGDHKPATKYSPTSLFLERLDSLFSLDPGLSAFLATDDPLAEEALREAFGSRIIVHPKSALDRSRAGILDAMVDLYCLAGTSKILGSSFSTFSRVAAEIGRIELETLSLHKGEPLEW